MKRRKGDLAEQYQVAGAGGIEPPNGGIKIRCLTAWLRPKRPIGPQKDPVGRILSGLAGLQRRVQHFNRRERQKRKIIRPRIRFPVFYPGLSAEYIECPGADDALTRRRTRPAPAIATPQTGLCGQSDGLGGS
jgi:hypothetical protein